MDMRGDIQSCGNFNSGEALGFVAQQCDRAQEFPTADCVEESHNYQGLTSNLS
jgi:hypothetical protein